MKKTWAERRKEKKEQYCFSVKEVQEIMAKLQHSRRALTGKEKENKRTRFNHYQKEIKDLFLVAHAYNPEKFLDQDQIDMFLELPKGTAKLCMSKTKRGLIEFEGYLLINNPGVGYKIADIVELVYEVDKGIARVFGHQFHAMLAQHRAIRTLELGSLTEEETKIHKYHETLLQSLQVALDAYETSKKRESIPGRFVPKKYQDTVVSGVSQPDFQ